jgi:glycosyltransferase involved in cell wall biosynthesis
VTHTAISTPKPVASVVLAVFNAERFVARTIESVLTQSFDDFELLLLDDGSSDRSLHIMQERAARDARCRVYSWPNRGYIATRNAGIELARGEFIVTMDADDICLPERLAKQITFLRSHTEYVAVGARVELIDPEDLPICEAIDCYSHEEIETALLSEAGQLSIAHPTSVIRRAALLQIGGYSSKYVHAEDRDLFLRLAEIGKLANLHEVLLRYRQHLKSTSYLHRVQQARVAAQAIADAKARRGLPPSSAVPAETALAVAPLTISSAHLMWAWWALRAGNVHTARKHALARLLHAPFNLESWRVTACACRGY